MEDVMQQKEETLTPVVIDLGSKRKKAVNDLKNGRGELLADVEHAVNHARANLPDEDKNKTVLPIVFIYRKKRRRRVTDSLPLSPINPLNLLRF